MRLASCLPICLSLAVPVGPAVQAQNGGPITFRVVAPDEAGLRRFGIVRKAKAQGDLPTIISEVERRLEDSRRLKSVNFMTEPEVWIIVDDCWRDETSRSRNKDGTETVASRYTVRGWVYSGGRHRPIESEVTRVDNTKDSRNDTLRFEEATKVLADRAFDQILSFLDALRPDRPDAGFGFVAKHKFLAKGDGLEVTVVAPKSPADRAGLAVGDRIRMIEGEKNTDDMYVLAREFWLKAPGSRVALEIEREKRRRTLEIVLLPPSRWSEKNPAPPAHERSVRPTPEGKTTVPAVSSKPVPYPREAVRVGGAVREPSLLKRVEPVAPPGVPKGVPPDVVLECLVSTGGRVQDVRVQQGDPTLAAAASAAVRQWVYVTPLVGGIPTPVILQVKLKVKH